MKIETAEATVNKVFSLYEKYGQADYIGEPVSQLQHMSQAAERAMQEGYDDEVIVAAFFHDIGHICTMNIEAQTMDGYGVVSHEKIGADFLRELGFPEKVAKLVENHVQAKRYLTYSDPEYYKELSEASKHTLAFQGGVMNEEEARAFKNDPLFEISIRMRHWDEMAKEEDRTVIDLQMMKEMALGVLVDRISK